MSHHMKGVGSFVVVAVLVYLAVRYWGSLTAGGVPGAKPGATLLDLLGFPPGNVSAGGPGDPAFSSAFGGSGNGGDFIIGPNGRVGDENSLAGGLHGFPGGFTGFGGSGGGTIDYTYLAAGSNVGPYANGSKSPCSTHLTDGKPICA